MTKLLLLLALAGIVPASAWAQSAGVPQSRMKADSAPTGCQLAFNIGMQAAVNHAYQESYDTLEAYVPRCPKDVNAPGAFGIMSEDVQQGGNGLAPQSWIDFKNWLLSALAWNPGDPAYFCSDVHALAGSLEATDPNLDTTWRQVNTGTNMVLSVLYWMIHNPACAPGDTEGYVNGRGSQLESCVLGSHGGPAIQPWVIPWIPRSTPCTTWDWIAC